ncbi:MAG: hypothetical protein JXQ93_05150 [Flavobacteriaceae bacterium]
MMKKFAKFYFWGFLINAIILLGIGSYLLVTKEASSRTTNLLLFAGAVQMIIFYGLLFYLYKGKLKDALKN